MKHIPPNLSEIYENLREAIYIMFYILIGSVAKLAYIGKQRKLDKKQALLTFSFGIFGGFVASQLAYLVSENMKWLLITAGALAGENIVTWLMLNGKDLISRIVDSIFKSKSK